MHCRREQVVADNADGRVVLAELIPDDGGMIVRVEEQSDGVPELGVGVLDAAELVVDESDGEAEPAEVLRLEP